MAQELLVSHIRRTTLGIDFKPSTETRWRCMKREAGINRLIKRRTVDYKHGLPRQRELRGDRSSALRRSSSQPRSSRMYRIEIIILGRDGISFRCTAGEWPWNERAPLSSLEMAVE